jgi:hypothetical protein
MQIMLSQPRQVGLVATLLLATLLGCDSPTPTPTGSKCESPESMALTWDNFGRDFMTKYCTMCHGSTLTRSMRNGAPLYHDFDSLLGVLQVFDHVDERAGAGPDADNLFMPGNRCPAMPGQALTIDCLQPSKQEREKLSSWLACEQGRPHSF